MSELVHGEGEAEQVVLSSLRLAMVLSVAILLVESVGAYFSHSLSVTVDAVHNIPDLIAFAVSFAALRSTEKGASDPFTFGAHRFEVFAGLLNAALVLGTGAVFGFEAVVSLGGRSSFAGTVDPVWVLIVAVPTLALRAANIVSLDRVPVRARDLNLKSVLVHVASDIAITGALVAMGAILLVRPSASIADPLAALAIAAVLVYESLPLFRGGWEVLTERTPRHLSIEAILAAARAVPNVAEVHDLHVWAVCPTLVCMTAHVEVKEMSVREGMAVVDDLRRTMEREFGILHATFEIEAPAM
ncbi:MAG TPA: cation diffusion facilitator family transporter [Thermoplasmata archaeon]|nr:cation diffusion facilitator family transporter [Thermoplasmata archaeon]